VTNSKTVEELLPADFECWPVWQFTLNRETESDLLVEPVKSLPVDTLNNRLAGTHIRPEAFAAAFRLSRSEMFPITYDLRQCCVGNPLCTTGEIQASPEEKLTPGEKSALALD